MLAVVVACVMEQRSAMAARTATRSATEKAKPPAATQGVAAVDRALSILGAFREGEVGISLAVLSQRTGLYKSTILRLIASLAANGYVRRMENGDYQVGAMAMSLGSIFQHSFKLEDFVTPALRKLVRVTKESASFYVRDGDHRLCLFRLDSPQAVRDHVSAGDRLPLERGAGGHVLKTFAEGAGKARGKDLIVATFGERQPDTAAVAAPVFGVGNRLHGALSVSGPKIRFNNAMVTCISNALRDVAADLTAELGGDGGVFAVRR